MLIGWIDGRTEDIWTCLFLFQTLEELRAQEMSEHSSAELETKTEVAQLNLRRAEVVCVCVCVPSEMSGLCLC